MQERENIERLEAAVRRLLETVDSLRRQNSDLLARLHDADSGREEREAELERLRAQRSEMLERVERLIGEIDRHTAAGGETDNRQPQGLPGLSG